MQIDVQFIKGVGPRRAETLSHLGINNIKDLLYYFPRDYDDRRNIKKIRYIKPGSKVTVKGKVISKKENRVKRGLSILRVTFSDDTDLVNGVWFNQSYLKKQFKKDQWYILSGELNTQSWRFNKKEMNNPVFEEINSGDTIHTGRVVPIYPLTEGINQKRLRQIIYNALKDYADGIPDILPTYIKEKYEFISLADSLNGLHFPDGRKNYVQARKRLAFEELFLFQLLVLKNKKGITERKGINHKTGSRELNEFLQSLPFSLTGSQQKVWKEIREDMEREIPMQRLLQGDVGAGKTVIAALALIETITNGFQGVFMAPTEILAEQHYQKLNNLLQPLGLKTGLVVGGLKPKERKEIEAKIVNGDIKLIIGTHALFQESISYQKIGLMVIDEQHRFGVEQRYRFLNKGENPDLLIMTATPIPRSLALTLYGDLDISVIDKLPPGRKPVVTTWRKEDSRPQIYKFVRKKLDEGRQAYVVCPLIEPSDEIDAVSARKIWEQLSDNFLQGYKIGLLHSQLKPEEKKKVMDEFRQCKIDVLVATTVIEVGVDVVNASVMVIENAERFGLAQLHQLRGRVGRGNYQSYCILIGNPTTDDGIKRLKVMTETNDGFRIAEEDLKIRGPGEFFGTKQHGLPGFKVASIIKDKKLLEKARQEAGQLIDMQNWEKKYNLLQQRINNRDLKL